MTLPKLLLFLTLPLYVLDQVTKFWTISTFHPPWIEPGASIVVVDNFFYLVRVHNQGVAFGFGNGTSWAPIVFLLVPLIALTLNSHANPDIYTVDLKNNARQRLTDSPGVDVSPSWSPDGTQMAFCSDRAGKPQVYVMNADGSHVKRLTNSPGVDYAPLWRPAR